MDTARWSCSALSVITERPLCQNILKAYRKRHGRKSPVATTGELCEIIKAAISAKVRSHRRSSCQREPFRLSALRLNHELDVLEESIDGMIRLLNPGGRLSIITFHSLERPYREEPVQGSMRIPVSALPIFRSCLCGRKSRGRVITRAHPSFRGGIGGKQPLKRGAKLRSV